MGYLIQLRFLMLKELTEWISSSELEIKSQKDSFERQTFALKSEVELKLAEAEASLERERERNKIEVILITYST